MVDDSAMLFIYFPLLVAGFRRTRLSRSVWALPSKDSSGKLTLPIPACTMPARSTRNSTFPALISRTTRPISSATVPERGFGIKPRGPRILPSLPTTPIISGVAAARSKSNHPSVIFCANSSAPTYSAPASSASRSFSPLANTSTRGTFPTPCGNTTLPRTIWSACLGFTPRRTAISTLSSNLAKASSCTSCKASWSSYLLLLSKRLRASSIFFPCCAILMVLPDAAMTLIMDDFQPHAARRASNDAHRCLYCSRIEISHLGLSNLAHLLSCYLPNFFPARCPRPFDDACRLFQ